MNEHERALWVAVCVAAMGKDVDCHEVATLAVREMRAAEATLTAEERGTPPFAAGDKVTLEHGIAEVLHAWWGDNDHVWYVDIMYQGRRMNRVTATSLPLPSKVSP